MFSQDEYDALHRAAGLLDRTTRGRLRLTGSDRRAYLQGLLTNDIAALSAGDGCYAALLTPQGRMISDMRVSELGDEVFIDLPAASTDAVRERLADFIFSEDVEVHDARASRAHFGVYGPEAPAMIGSVLSLAGGAASAARLGGLALNGNTWLLFAGRRLPVVRSDDYGEPGFELFPETDTAGDLMRAVRERGAVGVSAGTADAVRIEAGRPEFGVDMDEHTIPLEAGIEDRALSFTKGCYVGQEVVIRVLHRGHGRVAKRLVGIVADAGALPLERGERLYDGEREVGILTSAVLSPALGRPIGLGYVHRDLAERGTVLQAGSPGRSRPVAVASLPFTRPAAG